MTDDQVVQQSAQETESSAAFEAGFNDTRGIEAQEPVKEEVKVEVKEEPVATPEPTPEPVPEPAPDPMVELKAQLDSVAARLSAVDKLPDRIRNIEGHIGGLTSQLKTAFAAKQAVEKTGGDAPTQTEIAKAEASGKWKQMREDYPEWAEAMEEQLSEVRAGFKPQPQVDLANFRSDIFGDVEARIADAERSARHKARVDFAHEGWEDTVKTPAFTAWFGKQPKETQALAASSQAKDAIRLIDGFVASTKKAKQDKQERLKAAITPQGTSAPPQPTINDEDAFEQSFNATRSG